MRCREPCTLDCGSDGVCDRRDKQQQCLCPFGKTGNKCENGEYWLWVCTRAAREDVAQIYHFTLLMHIPCSIHFSWMQPMPLALLMRVYRISLCPHTHTNAAIFDSERESIWRCANCRHSSSLVQWVCGSDNSIKIASTHKREEKAKLVRHSAQQIPTRAHKTHSECIFRFFLLPNNNKFFALHSALIFVRRLRAHGAQGAGAVQWRTYVPLCDDNNNEPSLRRRVAEKRKICLWTILVFALCECRVPCIYIYPRTSRACNFLPAIFRLSNYDRNNWNSIGCQCSRHAKWIQSTFPVPNRPAKWRDSDAMRQGWLWMVHNLHSLVNIVLVSSTSATLRNRILLCHAMRRSPSVI